MNTKYQTNGALMVGPVVPTRDLHTGETLGVITDNRQLFMALAKRFRIRRHSDGWFVDGSRHRSQIWEFGVAKLGLTVVGPKFVQKCRRAGDWLKPKSIGDEEANFYCDWTDENLANLKALTGIQTRNSPSPSQAIGQMPEDHNSEQPENP